MSEEEYALIDSADAAPPPPPNAAEADHHATPAAAAPPPAPAEVEEPAAPPQHHEADAKNAPHEEPTGHAAATAAAEKSSAPPSAAHDPAPASAHVPAAAATAAVAAPPSGDNKSIPASEHASVAPPASAPAPATVKPAATTDAAAASAVPAAKPHDPPNTVAPTPGAATAPAAAAEAPTFAPLSVPLHRRRQTCTVLTWLLTPLVCALVSLYLVRSSGILFYLFLAYIMWMVFAQKYHKNGGHPQRWFKRLIWWKWMAEYFPIRLHKTVDIPSDKSYIFGYHPHGIISLGAFCNFATDGTGFESKFPGINLRLLTLTANFRIPFYGFYLTALGLCDASPESCQAILRQGKGNSLMLVLGGAKESLDAHPGTADLTLRDRKGFVKIALMAGASLVPVFGFGETDLYDQVDNPVGSKLRVIQELLQAKLGFALPLVKGRGVFNYRAGLLPHRKLIDAVVGAPIDCPKLTREQITNEVLNEYHEKYLTALQKLYDDHKNVYAPKRRKSMTIVR